MKIGSEIKCHLLPQRLTNCEMFDVLVEHELFCSRRGIRASLGNLKQEEEGRQRRRFDDHIFLTPSVSKGNRRLEVGWNIRMEDVRVSFSVERPKYLCFMITDLTLMSLSRARKRSTEACLFGFDQKADFSGMISIATP